MKVVGISGSISNPSRTVVLVKQLTERLATSHAAIKTEFINIGELNPELGTTIDPRSLPAALDAAFKKVYAADVLVIGTPIYKASYTGLLKHFFDLLDPEGLRGRIAVLAATGGSDYHALALEHQLRPLVSFFGMQSVPTVIYARDRDFEKDGDNAGYKLVSEDTLRRIDGVVEQTVELLRGRHAVSIVKVAAAS